MAVNKEAYKQLIADLSSHHVTLVAVSKTKSVEDILELYHLGQKDFGENYVQELVEKYPKLPKDIRWHFIGHLQTNKVKLIAPFVHLIHSVDREKLLREINKEAAKNNRIVDCLLQVHIAKEETKFGLDAKEAEDLITRIVITNSRNAAGKESYQNITIKGMMGMASFIDDQEVVRKEFQSLKTLFDQFTIHHSPFTILSMGMSGDYKIAIEEGSTLVRIGSLLFGKREQKKQ